jgi:hypothetical protein
MCPYFFGLTTFYIFGKNFLQFFVAILENFRLTINNNRQKHILSSRSIYFDHKKGFQFEIKPNFYLAH